MAATLTETLLAPEFQPQVVNDCYQLIDQQISEMSGVSGAAASWVSRGPRPTVTKAYSTARGGAAKHLQTALPRVGALVQKYAA